MDQFGKMSFWIAYMQLIFHKIPYIPFSGLALWCNQSRWIPTKRSFSIAWPSVWMISFIEISTYHPPRPPKQPASFFFRIEIDSFKTSIDRLCELFSINSVKCDSIHSIISRFFNFQWPVYWAIHLSQIKESIFDLFSSLLNRFLT